MDELKEAIEISRKYCYVQSPEIAESMEIFLSQKWLKVEDRQPLLSMWEWYRENLHFVDSYLLACSKLGKSKILTFDKALSKKLQGYLD